MSTRACYSFTDDYQTFHVYKHHDGYPKGAAEAIAKGMAMAWEMPRFEASDAGAAFVAANRNGQGGVRLMPSGNIAEIAPWDIQYRYEIAERDGAAWVRAFNTRADGDMIWEGPLAAMAAWAATT